MSSESREVQHNQHEHPTNRFYLIIGAVLLGLTVLEVVGYLGEESGALPTGAATTIILLLSAAKFLLVVALYMHLKFDHKLFTGLFVFPALLATLVICGMIFLFGPIHGTSTAIHGTATDDEGIHGAATAPKGNPGRAHDALTHDRQDLMFNAVLGLALHGEAFSWSEWRVYPSFMAGWLLLGGGYFLMVGPLRHRFAGSRPVPARKVASFVMGLLLMFVALQGPMHELSDYFLFSAHMVQHLVLILVMPPFLLYGTPDWALRPLLRGRFTGPVARALTLPLVAFALNNVIFLAWHFPGPYDLMMRDHGVHVGMHLMIMVTGTIMWWPVLSPLPELPRIAPVLQMVYLFLVGIPMMISAALITFSQTALYTWYVEAPRVLPGLSPLEDQRLGGVIMRVPGGLTLWLAITLVYFRWTQRERREDESVALRQPAVTRSGLIVPPPFPQG